ncbi:helix-turn-helix transcriptional regulator [Sinomonas sp. ASV486]|uniref:helix-turn-helix domain-containing protein n=1 Tax=Sinomonas sp. ASV486 TaxID=3051170 RepID=UPI0027DC153F|nr:helix-turn-helix transcriptional regulator [Sinomonas sp. ASV486]MDQ4489034.1 helix-turn-helix transcriptional regulator [Sinomonas sp. ASV486]
MVRRRAWRWHGLDQAWSALGLGDQWIELACYRRLEPVEVLLPHPRRCRSGSRPYSEIAARAKAVWSDDATELPDQLRVGLRAEVSERVALGHELAAARTAAHLTQPELASRAGVQQADISRIERGLGNPTRDTLLKIADALDVRIAVVPKHS